MDIKVGIIMGSDSDLPVMSKAAEILDELKVAYELTIVSAHRTPGPFMRICKNSRGERNQSHYCRSRRRRPPSGVTAAMTVLPGDRCAGADKGPWRHRFSLLHRSDASGNSGGDRGNQWGPECRTFGGKDFGDNRMPNFPAA